MVAAPNVPTMEARHLVALLGVCLPLTALWGYVFLICLREHLHAPREEGEGGVFGQGPLDPLSWALLLLLTGWFGALAYVCTKIVPRYFQSGALRSHCA